MKLYYALYVIAGKNYWQSEIIKHIYHIILFGETIIVCDASEIGRVKKTDNFGKVSYT